MLSHLTSSFSESVRTFGNNIARYLYTNVNVHFSPPFQQSICWLNCLLFYLYYVKLRYYYWATNELGIN